MVIVVVSHDVPVDGFVVPFTMVIISCVILANISLIMVIMMFFLPFFL